MYYDDPDIDFNDTEVLQKVYYIKLLFNNIYYYLYYNILRFDLLILNYTTYLVLYSMQERFY